MGSSFSSSAWNVSTKNALHRASRSLCVCSLDSEWYGPSEHAWADEQHQNAGCLLAGVWS
jgi:hypothetical protein